MAICPVNSDGWCTRHNTHHAGRLLEWALSPTMKGEKYRELWDRQMANGRVETKPAVVAPTALRLLACVHLGKPLDRLGCHCKGKWVHACEMHGKCTIATPRDEMPCCRGGNSPCSDYSPDDVVEPL